MTGKSEPIAGTQPFLVTVFPSKLFSAFTSSNVSILAGQDFSLTLLGRDKFGNLVNTNMNTLEAMLFGDYNASKQSSFANFIGGGFYQAAFRITKSGQYMLLVQIDSDTPQRNPFWVICEPELQSNPLLSGLTQVIVGNVTQLVGQDSTGGTTGVLVSEIY